MHGILLVTGPTGSGKTTTLYTALDRLNKPDVKIVTVEDPVEYQMPGINQIQVKPQIELTFANALRSIVRQDPDIIMVGEIRDVETVRIAMQSALTGHMVLSTVHTNDAPSTVNRLLDMGAEDYLLTSTVNGVLAQRLVRTLCEKCREPHVALPEVIQQMGLRRFQGTGEITLYKPVGCPECAGTGYWGRICIIEMMTMTDANALAHHAPRDRRASFAPRRSPRAWRRCSRTACASRSQASPPSRKSCASRARIEALPFFQYKAVNPAGEIQEGVLEAASAASAVARIQEMGFIPIRAEEAGAAQAVAAPRCRHRALPSQPNHPGRHRDRHARARHAAQGGPAARSQLRDPHQPRRDSAHRRAPRQDPQRGARRLGAVEGARRAARRCSRAST